MTLQATCHRCNAGVDRAVAYKQMERYKGIRCTVYYCADCVRTLAAWGDGEADMMAERRADTSDRTPAHKEEC